MGLRPSGYHDLVPINNDENEVDYRQREHPFQQEQHEHAQPHDQQHQPTKSKALPQKGLVKARPQSHEKASEGQAANIKITDPQSIVLDTKRVFFLESRLVKVL